MSLLALLTSAGTLGVLGGVHCVAMCSALQRTAVHGLPGGSGRIDPDPATAALLQPQNTATIHSGMQAVPVRFGSRHRSRRDLAFQAGRLIGYSALGAVAGGGSALLRLGAEVLPLMKPAWTLLNSLLLMLGLSLVVLGRQPAWIDALGQRIWQGLRLRQTSPGRLRPIVAGLAWALLPCGLLYSALATATLASDPIRGAAVMLSFGAGTALHLLAAQWLLGRLQAGASGARLVEAAGVRLGGLLLAGMAVAALMALALGQPHPFCS